GANKINLNTAGDRLTAGTVIGTGIGADLDNTRGITLGDINADGYLDVIAGNYSEKNKLYLNDGSSGFLDATDIGIDTNNLYVTLGDIDADGYLDLITGNNGINKLYLNDRSGGFLDATNIGTDNDGTYSITLGDIDADGDLDVIAGNNSKTNKLYLNNGTTAPFLNVTGTAIGTDADITYSITLGDIDADGDLDVIAGNKSAANKFYLNDGSGGFPDEGAAIDTDENDTISITLGDINGDGDLDVIAGNYGNGSGEFNKLYLNDGSGGFSAGTNIGSTDDDDTTMSITLGDIDADGDLDVIAGNYGANKLYLNNGTDTPFHDVPSGDAVTGVDIGSDTDTTYSITLGDIDGDGDLDVIAGNDG
ncbi:MAG: VCBS repeat-containing protein, partial [Gammaproteobacteria bacterium]|nr:VCBS repeat-containing protein [Gammaproteobacteria bacterium]